MMTFTFHIEVLQIALIRFSVSNSTVDQLAPIVIKNECIECEEKENTFQQLLGIKLFGKIGNLIRFMWSDSKKKKNKSIESPCKIAYVGFNIII